MEEKIIIKSESGKIVKLSRVLCIIGLAVSLVPFVLNMVVKDWENEGLHSLMELLVMDGLLVGGAGAVLNSLTAKCVLTVTENRVYGNAAFGKRVDLPMDSISAVATGALNSVAVATSSGAIKFFGIENKDDIYKAISDLLIARQKKPKEAVTVKQEIPQSAADELKKYKDLLDSGAISQEEFDAKKKQLLGL